MASITIKNWEVVEQEGGEVEFIEPEYSTYAWQIPKWWYRRGDKVYTNCARLDVAGSSIYIDGTSPLMEITIEWETVTRLNGTITATSWTDIRRLMVLNTDNLGPVNRRESDEYIDVEFDKYSYRIRHDNYNGPDVIQPLQADVKPVWVNGNDSHPYYTDEIPFITGTYVGGIEPVTYEYRHKEQEKEGGEWTTPTDFFPQTNTPTEKTISLDGKSKAKKIHIETKATDAEGTVVYNNGPYLVLDNPVVTITENPAVSSFNQYVVGETVVGFAGAFTGGVEGAYARARWRWRASKDDSYTGDEWTINVESLQEVRSSPIPEGMIQAQFQYQVIEPGTSTGNGNRISNKSTTARDVTPAPPAPPPSTSWGAIILYVNDVEYNTFLGLPVEVVVGEPQNVRVEWEGNATGYPLWSQRAGGSASFDDATSATPVVTMTAPGSTFITVTLTDPDGLADPVQESKTISFWAAAA